MTTGNTRVKDKSKVKAFLLSKQRHSIPASQRLGGRDERKDKRVPADCPTAVCPILPRLSLFCILPFIVTHKWTEASRAPCTWKILNNNNCLKAVILKPMSDPFLDLFFCLFVCLFVLFL